MAWKIDASTGIHLRRDCLGDNYSAKIGTVGVIPRYPYNLARPDDIRRNRSRLSSWDDVTSNPQQWS